MKETFESKARSQAGVDNEVRIEEILSVNGKEYVLFKGDGHINFFSLNCGKSIKPILYDRKIVEVKMHTNKK